MSLLETEQLSPPARPHRFTLEEYYRMAEMDFFSDRRVEFIDGEIIDAPPQFNPHSYVITRLSRILLGIFPESAWWVRIQTTLQTAGSAPDPDFVVLNAKPDMAHKVPRSDGAAAVIEVADATLLYDTTVKASLYAAGGVPEYWVVSIPDREIIVHRDPVESATAKFGWKYATVSTVKSGTSIALHCMPETKIDPTEILPPIS